MTEPASVVNNIEASRYELEVDGEIAIAVYQQKPGVVVFTHTEVPDALAGRGIGSRLIGGALRDVRANDLKIVPLCEFVAAYLDKHPEEQDLLARDAPG